MSNFSKEIGGKPVRIKDCYIWSEIYYLDSPTDYREYLPQQGGHSRTSPSDGLVMLDTLGHIRPGLRLLSGRGFLIVFLVLSYLLCHVNQ
jgi:hypothetical protein